MHLCICVLIDLTAQKTLLHELCNVTNLVLEELFSQFQKLPLDVSDEFGIQDFCIFK